ncbi:WD repeat-containing protein 47 isoform X1 [Neodiprion pinetum]|uniref:WD repeat-containing protein 47 isoform X2 n=2 Tax=Neodiprion fabricii TaxID=2872261 RepID=UPI001ED8C251|nr:WD repeat-containing protein 47 isoform X2 [Neodiprion fabricii]XP_046465634.1 WD repeat-containing protein 47 isoform X1 [Neodiprion pinetum]XP_046603367.1 WD repeat-containing protein 47 isoform X2 [Neodiprion virginianus]
MVVATSSTVALAEDLTKDTLGRLRIRYVMPAAHLTLREEDVVRLTLEFLHSRDLHISQLSLERETGVINGQYSDDVLFLRQLILDGQWDDVLEFIQPLEALPDFDMRKFTYSILRHKYVELLCIKSEANVIVGANGSVDNAVEEVVKVLSDLEKVAPSKDEYSSLCLLLTLPRLTDHLQYKDWNPSNARVQCFREVYPLVEKFLPGDRKSSDNTGVVTSAKNDRMIQLVIKGILYESCVNYCQAKATGSKESEQVEMNFSRLLDGSVGFSDSDLSLLSWLQSIPPETFAVPFAQRTLNVDVERLERPSLETSWTEHMLITPIKPKTFPHSAMPFTRPRSAADMMSRSLVPALEGLGSRSPGLKNNPIPSAALMAMSTGDINPMSRSSFASFHLTGFKNNKLMNTSVDRLFENEGDVFLSSSYADFQQLPSIQEAANNVASLSKAPPRTRGQSKSPEGIRADPSAASTPERRMAGRESPAPSTARSSRRDSLADKPPGVQQKIPEPTLPVGVAALVGPDGEILEPSFNGDLFKEFQKQKQRLQETIQLKEKERDELVRQLTAPLTSNQVNATDNRLQDDTMKQPLNSKGPSPVHSSTPSRSGIQSPKPATNGTTDPLSRQNSTSNNFYEQRLQDGIYDVVKPAVKQEPRPDLDVSNGSSSGGRPRFVPVTALEDVQAVRCAEFHPHGKLYAVGSNSKTLRICAYPKLSDVREDHQTYQPTVLFKRTKHHKGSIYCLAWTPDGQLMATGSNDKTVKLMRFNAENSNLEGQEVELTMHDGTVRDLCFLEDTSNKSSLLISGGAGDCKIYVTDCATGTPFQALSGHSGHVLTLYNWGGAMFVSGSQDKTVRFWDLRTRGCVNMVTPATVPGSRHLIPLQVGSPVAALCVDPSGRLLVSGHEDSSCVLFDIRGGRTVQCFKPHASDIRSIRFSPSAYYLLTGGYDNKLVLTDLQGDLTMPLPSVVVAQHQDKVISGRWHPTEFSFLSTSADKTATLWALPPV